MQVAQLSKQVANFWESKILSSVVTLYVAGQSCSCVTREFSWGGVSICLVAKPWAVPAACLVQKALPTGPVREKGRDQPGDVVLSCVLLGKLGRVY